MLSSLLSHPGIQAARRHLERTDDLTLARQAELSALAAPTGVEGRRGARIAELFRDAGLRDILVDEVGNVHAWWGAPGAAAVVVAAHLDTVFGPDVDVRVTRQGRNGRLTGPGISDNARGLAALVAVAEALSAARVALRHPVMFVSTVGEEGGGNLRGMRHLFARDGLKPHAVIALDGAGIDRVVHRALGSRRYRVTFRGPGGHSWSAFGVANPAAAVGRAVQRLADLRITEDSRTTCAVVGLGGGTALNSIPQEAWVDLDLRSEDAAALARLDAAVQAVLARARDEESSRRAAGTAALTMERQLLGDRPSGETAAGHPLVQAALAATRALGKVPELAAASTDANVPIALGVPAIALGAGGRAGDVHLPSEWYENEEGALGLVRALWVTAAMAGVPQPATSPTR
jgi:tripeptide aminopeptidase